MSFLFLGRDRHPCACLSKRIVFESCASGKWKRGSAIVAPQDGDMQNDRHLDRSPPPETGISQTAGPHVGASPLDHDSNSGMNVRVTARCVSLPSRFLRSNPFGLLDSVPLPGHSASAGSRFRRLRGPSRRRSGQNPRRAGLRSRGSRQRLLLAACDVRPLMRQAPGSFESRQRRQRATASLNLRRRAAVSQGRGVTVEAR